MCTRRKLSIGSIMTKENPHQKGDGGGPTGAIPTKPRTLRPFPAMILLVWLILYFFSLLINQLLNVFFDICSSRFSLHHHVYALYSSSELTLKSEPYATEQVEEKAEEFFDNSSSRDRDRSSSYDSDRSSSSSSSFGSASARTEICPLCHGESEATNEDCDFCGGWGKVKIREGACKRGCGCQVYISRLYGSTCINCLLTFDCYGTESDHEH